MWLLFAPSLCQNDALIFLCHSTMNVCPNEAAMRAKNLVFTRRENRFTWHLVWLTSTSIVGIETRIVGSSKTELSSLHALAKSPLELLPLWAALLTRWYQCSVGGWLEVCGVACESEVTISYLDSHKPSHSPWRHTNSCQGLCEVREAVGGLLQILDIWIECASCVV